MKIKPCAVPEGTNVRSGKYKGIVQQLLAPNAPVALSIEPDGKLDGCRSQLMTQAKKLGVKVHTKADGKTVVVWLAAPATAAVPAAS
jgi:hypothetical protein